jgi:lipopolysaccharide export system protein LptA
MPRPSHLPILALAAVASLAAADLSMDQFEPGTGAARLTATSSEMDMREGHYHFWGNVEFRYPGMLDLDCDDLVIRLLTGGNKIDRLIASNNVVMTIVQLPSTNAVPRLNPRNSTNRVHAAVAEFISTNDTVVLTGSPSFGQPWVEGAEGSFRADQITFDRGRGKIGAKGNFKMIIRPEAVPKGSFTTPHTNAPVAPPAN